MKVQGIDERKLREQGYGSSFVVFVFEGDDTPRTSWSVDSLLLTETALPQVLEWLRSHLPDNCCWALATVNAPRHPTPDSTVDVAWIIGDDVLNVPHEHRSDEERRVAAEMLERRHRVPVL